MKNKSKIYSISDEEFRQLIKNNTCYSDVLRYFELSTTGEASRKILKKRIAELSCDTSHFISYKLPSKEYFTKYTLEEILIENSNYLNKDRLKRRLISENKLLYECDVCKISDWLDKPLSLQLDHINGINNDNRLENLRFLCPNCHSQTSTYAGRNKLTSNANTR